MKQKSRQKGVHIDHIESMSCHDIKHRRKINKLLYNYCRRGLAEKCASLVYTHYSTSPLCNTLVRVTFSPGARWIPHPIRKVCLKTAYNTKKQQVIIRCPVDTIHPQHAPLWIPVRDQHGGTCCAPSSSGPIEPAPPTPPLRAAAAPPARITTFFFPFFFFSGFTLLTGTGALALLPWLKPQRYPQ